MVLGCLQTGGQAEGLDAGQTSGVEASGRAAGVSMPAPGGRGLSAKGGIQPVEQHGQAAFARRSGRHAAQHVAGFRGSLGNGPAHFRLSDIGVAAAVQFQRQGGIGGRANDMAGLADIGQGVRIGAGRGGGGRVAGVAGGGMGGTGQRSQAGCPLAPGRKLPDAVNGLPGTRIGSRTAFDHRERPSGAFGRPAADCPQLIETQREVSGACVFSRVNRTPDFFQ